MNKITYGRLANQAGEQFPVRVLKSAAGFYLGTTDEEGAPFTRESCEYWMTEADAEKALQTGDFTQKPNF